MPLQRQWSRSGFWEGYRAVAKIPRGVAARSIISKTGVEGELRSTSMNKNRVEALSDGVFAIVITLLILDIKVPEVDGSQLSASLIAVLPRIFAYVISFGVIGVYWL